MLFENKKLETEEELLNGQKMKFQLLSQVVKKTSMYAGSLML